MKYLLKVFVVISCTPMYNNIKNNRRFTERGYNEAVHKVGYFMLKQLAPYD